MGTGKIDAVSCSKDTRPDKIDPKYRRPSPTTSILADSHDGTVTVLQPIDNRRGVGPLLKGMRWGVKERTLAAILGAAILVTSGGAAQAAGKSCGPFGDPPASIISTTVPRCPNGTLLGPWQDSDGTDRYSCLYEPPSAGMNNQLPMVVFLHPSLADADSIQFTNLQSFMDTADVSGNASRPGFTILAPQGRNITHFYTSPDATGLGWDNWYRQFGPDQPGNAQNVDAATIDHFIAAEVATGKVDQNRIYITGWSNGAAMAYIYGLNRANIAAVGVYSAPDPWRFSIDPCEQLPVASMPKKNRQIGIANPHVPTYQVHNGCDIVGLCPNAERMEKQLRKIGVPVTDQIIGLPKDPTNPANQQSAKKCFAVCGSNPNGNNTNGKGNANHLRWPTDWTQSMLDFFRTHPLNAQ